MSPPSKHNSPEIGSVVRRSEFEHRAVKRDMLLPYLGGTGGSAALVESPASGPPSRPRPTPGQAAPRSESRAAVGRGAQLCPQGIFLENDDISHAA